MIEELLFGSTVGSGADQLCPPSVETLRYTLSAQRLRKKPSSAPSRHGTIDMWTQPVLSGTATSSQLRPASAESSTEEVSRSPVQAPAGGLVQRQIGNSHSPRAFTTMALRMKVP